MNVLISAMILICSHIIANSVTIVNEVEVPKISFLKIVKN